MSDNEGGGWRLVTFVWQYSSNRTNPYEARLIRCSPGGFLLRLYRWAEDNRREYPRLEVPTPHLVCCCEVSDTEAAGLEASGVSVLPMAAGEEGGEDE